jgi:hypothetical protein
MATNFPNGHKYVPIPNGHNRCTYTNIFESKALIIYPNCDFWFENTPSGNPALIGKKLVIFSPNEKNNAFFIMSL